jgi:hypothetical protein
MDEIYFGVERAVNLGNGGVIVGGPPLPSANCRCAEADARVTDIRVLDS